MAVTIADLIKFNNVESTDIINGLFELPYMKPAPFRAGVTYTDGYEKYINGGQGAGSQVIIRQLGGASATKIKANLATAFDYSHANTGDAIKVVPIDDVIKHSEKIYEAVEVARQSKTGASKAQLTLETVIEGSQSLISEYLQDGAILSTNLGTITKTNLKDLLIQDYALLDYVPTVLVVKKQVIAVLMQLITDGDFQANPAETVLRTGILGTILGMNVVYDPYLVDYDYVMYNHEHFSVFNALQAFSIVPATDFDGSYARALMLQGGDAPSVNHGSGSWAVKHETVEFTVSFNVDGGSAVASQTVAWGDKATEPADPTKSSFVFSGWFKDSGKTVAFVFENEIITANTTIYAKWVAE